MQDDRSPVGSRPVTQHDIAARCGVGRATVSMALRGDPKISPATAARVRAAAEELGYSLGTYSAARRLIYHRYGRAVPNQLVALIMPRYYHLATYFAQIAHGVQDVLLDQQFGMVIACVDTGMMGLPPIFARGEIDGCIYYANPIHQDALLAQLAQAPHRETRPLVSLLVAEHPMSAAVLVDDAQGGYLAARHLLALGHRHLLHFYPDSMKRLLPQRFAGVLRAYGEWGLDPAAYLHLTPAFELGPQAPPEHGILIDEMPAAHPAHAALQCVAAYLRAHPAITGILAENDAMARRLWYGLGARGFRLPDELSIVGFDDTETITDAQGRNVLTTIRVPGIEAGRTAASLLLAQLDAGTPDPTARRILPVELIARGSTAPPPRR